MGEHVAIGICIFCLTYMVIISEKINRTAIALFGAVAMLILNVVTQELAFDYIDFGTIFLLIGMMIIVSIIQKTGVFEYLAIKMAKLAKGEPWRIILFFSILTAIASAFLDNVTTILLVAPVTIVIADALGLNPIPFLLPEVLLANIGGTATLIGDPPNIMIGSATGLGFLDFLINLAPVVIVIVVATMIYLEFVYRKHLKCDPKRKERVLKMNEHLAIKNKPLLIKCIIVLVLTIIGFMIHQQLGYESATIALAGAALLLLISKIEPEEVFHDIEWPTIFFFAALFILVGALEHIGVIGYLSNQLFVLTKGDMFFTAMLVLWGSAILSAFLDNIPFVATMIPLIKHFGEVSGMNITPLWWALALGACLGGNGTLVGASANVIVAGLLNKHGHKISFLHFMKIGFPVMILSVIISTIYMTIVYF